MLLLKRVDELKNLVAKEALSYIEDGMVIGIGSGSTVEFFIRELGSEVRSGNIKILGVPTSIDTMIKMKSFGIPIANPYELDKIDLAVDGADSVLLDKKILIKGGGGAFVREKIVDYWAKRLIIIVDYRKIDREFPIPVEVLEFSLKFVQDVLGREFGEVNLRKCSGKVGPCISDNGNIILDLNIPINNLSREMEWKINRVPGVIDNGIFSRDCEIIIGKKDGEIELIKF